MKKVLITLMFAIPLVAQRPHPDPLPQYLQLTPSQQAAWEQAHTEFRAVVEPLLAKEKEAHDALEVKLQAVLTPEQKAKYDAFEAAAAFLREQHGPPPMR